MNFSDDQNYNQVNKPNLQKMTPNVSTVPKPSIQVPSTSKASVSDVSNLSKPIISRPSYAKALYSKAVNVAKPIIPLSPITKALVSDATVLSKPIILNPSNNKASFSEILKLPNPVISCSSTSETSPSKVSNVPKPSIPVLPISTALTADEYYKSELKKCFMDSKGKCNYGKRIYSRELIELVREMSTVRKSFYISKI